jgi:hypothetical protein
MMHGQIPSFIYERLPLFYVCAGILTMYLLRNAIAVFSGIVFIIAGIIVWSVRHEYRKNNADSPKNRSIRNTVKVYKNIT